MSDEHLTMIGLLSYEVDQYQVMIKSKQLIQSLPKWREQATKLKMLLTDCVDYQCLRRERDVFITCMDNVDDASTTLVDMYMEAEVDIPMDMEDLEIYNYELVKRINSKMIMLKDTKSNVSKVSMISSSTFRRSDTGKQAAAIAAELEVKLQYMYMEAEQYELERNRNEKELAMSFEVDQYQVMIKSKQLIQSLPKWREQATKLEMLLTDCVDYQCLRRERDVLMTCMDNVDDASTTFVDLYLYVDIPIDMEDLEICNYELVKRINSKMIMLKDTKSNVSKVYMISSSTFRRSDTGMQAAAIAAELEVKLQYVYMEAEQYELDRNRTEKELEIAKARLRAVNEVNGLQGVSQTQSVTIERLSYTNCIDGFMQLDSVHYPVNELDNQFEGSVVVLPGGCFGTSPLDSGFGDTFVVGESCGDKLDWWHGVVSRDSPGVHSFMNQDSVHYPVNEGDNQFEGSVVVPPGGCFGTSPLNVRFGDTFVVGESCGDKLDGWHGVVSREGPGLLGFADCPSRCETAIANRSNLGAFSDGREMQALQSKRSEWVGLSGPNVQLVISTKSATDEVASTQNISDPCVRGHKSDGIFKLPITAYTIPHIPINLSHIPTPDTARQWPHLEWIVHQLTPLQDVEFALLIGHNFNIALMSIDVVRRT